MPEVVNEKWVNIDEAAEYLGVKPGTIRDWIRKRGVFQHIKLANSESLNVPNLMPGWQAEKVPYSSEGIWLI